MFSLYIVPVIEMSKKYNLHELAYLHKAKLVDLDTIPNEERVNLMIQAKAIFDLTHERLAEVTGYRQETVTAWFVTQGNSRRSRKVNARALMLLCEKIVSGALVPVTPKATNPKQ